MKNAAAFDGGQQDGGKAALRNVLKAHQSAVAADAPLPVYHHVIDLGGIWAWRVYAIGHSCSPWLVASW